jgi:hypothetical protein
MVPLKTQLWRFPFKKMVLADLSLRTSPRDFCCCFQQKAPKIHHKNSAWWFHPPMKKIWKKQSIIPGWISQNKSLSRNKGFGDTYPNSQASFLVTSQLEVVIKFIQVYHGKKKNTILYRLYHVISFIIPMVSYYSMAMIYPDVKLLRCLTPEVPDAAPRPKFPPKFGAWYLPSPRGERRPGGTGLSTWWFYRKSHHLENIMGIWIVIIAFHSHFSWYH